MTNDAKPQAKDDAAPILAEARRPYKRPVLRRLGSVREVTWGNPGSGADGPLRRMSLGKM